MSSSNNKYFYLANPNDISLLYLQAAKDKMHALGFSLEQIQNLTPRISEFANDLDSFHDRRLGITIARRTTSFANRDQRILYASNLHHEVGHRKENISPYLSRELLRERELASEKERYQDQRLFLESRKQYLTSDIPIDYLPLDSEIASDYEAVLGL